MKPGLGWLAVGFLGNGLAQFSQKYLHASGLGDYQAATLVIMYFAGAVFALLVTLWFGGRVGHLEWVVGLSVGFCSYAGNFAVLRALGSLPAYVVFPIVVAGPILVVALFSAIVLRERLSRSAIMGVLCGMAGAVLLTLG